VFVQLMTGAGPVTCVQCGHVSAEPCVCCVSQCIKLEEKELYKQMISQLSSTSSNSTRATPAAVSSAISFRNRQDRFLCFTDVDPWVAASQ